MTPSPSNDVVTKLFKNLKTANKKLLEYKF